MEASKVTITPETWRAQGLSVKKRYKLKRELVYQLIRSRPYGQALRDSDVAKVLVSSRPAAFNFLRKLTDNGDLIKHQISPKRSFYIIPEEVRTIGVITDADPASFFAERDQKMMDVIAGLPYGKMISPLKLGRQFGLSGPRTHQILKRLVKAGHLIAQAPIDTNYGKFYYVPDKSEATIVPSAPQKDEIDEEKLNELNQAGRPAIPAPRDITEPVYSEPIPDNLESIAMRFGWEHPLFNNDLREFVKWHQKNQ